MELEPKSANTELLNPNIIAENYISNCVAEKCLLNFYFDFFLRKTLDKNHTPSFSFLIIVFKSCITPLLAPSVRYISSGSLQKGTRNFAKLHKLPTLVRIELATSSSCVT